MKVGDGQDAFYLECRQSVDRQAWATRSHMLFLGVLWSALMDLMDSDKREMLTSRADEVLLCFKQQFPVNMYDELRRELWPFHMGGREQIDFSRTCC